MLTLFTLPKPFVPPFDTIQHNALRSWTALKPTPRLILFGDEAGTREAAAQFGAAHIPEIARNELGTPLVDQLFRTATERAATPYQGFVNADIILDPSLPALLEKVFAWNPRALIVSRRWDVDIKESIAVETPGIFAQLADQARREGQLYSHLGMDVFIFPTGFFDHMPPFSIGWPGAKYDNWMVYAAHRRGVPVVDVTDALTNIHQNHPSGTANNAKACEHWINLDHLGGHGCCYDILDATHGVGPDGVIRRSKRSRENLQRDLFRLMQRARYRFRRRVLGFRYAERQS